MRNILLLFSFVFFGFFFASRASAQQLQWQSYVDTSAQSIDGASDYQGDLIAIDRSGNIWVLYAYNVSQYESDTISVGKFDGQTWTHYAAGQNGLLPGHLDHIIRDHNDDIWVSGDSGIAKYSNGKWQSYTIQDSMTGKRSYGAIAADSSGNVWVGTLAYRFATPNVGGTKLDSAVGQIFRFDGSAWDPFPIPFPDTVDPSFWSGISAIDVAPNGVVWAGSAPPLDNHRQPWAGLWKFTESWQAFNLKDGIDSNMTSIGPVVIHSDRQGGIWVSFINDNDGTNLLQKSIDYFDGTGWVESAYTGLRFNRVWLAPNGDRYFLQVPNSADTVSGALVIANDQGIIDSISKNNIPYYPYYDVAFAANGNIWLQSTGGHEAILETFAAPSSVSPTNSPNSTLQCSVYPNPMLADAAHLSLSGAESGVYQITLTNTLGIVLKTASVNASGTPTCDLSTSDLASGAYLITIANGAERVTVPVVKE